MRHKMASLAIAVCASGCAAHSGAGREVPFGAMWVSDGLGVSARCSAAVAAAGPQVLPVPPWFVELRGDWAVVIELPEPSPWARLLPTVALMGTADGLLAYHVSLRDRWFSPTLRLNNGLNERPVWARVRPSTGRRVVSSIARALEDDHGGTTPHLLMLVRRRGEVSAAYVPVAVLAEDHETEGRVHRVAAPELSLSPVAATWPDESARGRRVRRHYITWYVEPATAPVLLRCKELE